MFTMRNFTACIKASTVGEEIKQNSTWCLILVVPYTFIILFSLNSREVQ